MATRILGVIDVLHYRDEKLVDYIPINRKAKCGFAAMSRFKMATLSRRHCKKSDKPQGDFFKILQHVQTLCITDEADDGDYRHRTICS